MVTLCNAIYTADVLS